jgi:hypothetical protein
LVPIRRFQTSFDCGGYAAGAPIVGTISFVRGTAARWIFYAVTFGLLWGVVMQALVFGDDALASVIGGVLAGVLFATLAIRRETRGVRRRPW